MSQRYKYKLLLIFLVINIKSTMVFSQLYSYGLHVGLNTMRTYNNSIDNSLYSFGYDFGIFAERKVYKNLSVGLSFNITQKKCSFNEYETTSFIETLDEFFQSFNNILPVEISIKDLLETYMGSSAALINDTVFNYYRDMTTFAYVEIPLLLSYNYKKFTVSAGPNFSFISRASSNTMLKQEIPLLDILPTTLFDTMAYGSYVTGTINALFPAYKDTIFDTQMTTSDYTSFNIGLLAGVSYQLYDNVFLSIFYSRMFSNIYNNSKKQAYHNLVNVGLKYNLPSIFRAKPSFSN